jgi:hypothetical protein
VTAPDRLYEDLERRFENLQREFSALRNLLGAREPWLDYKALAAHFSTSVRTVQTWKAEGMPMQMLDGKCKGQLSEILPWLATHGHEGYVSRPEPTTVAVGSTNRGGTADSGPPPDTTYLGGS